MLHDALFSNDWQPHAGPPRGTTLYSDILPKSNHFNVQALLCSQKILKKKNKDSFNTDIKISIPIKKTSVDFFFVPEEHHIKIEKNKKN